MFGNCRLILIPRKLKSLVIPVSMGGIFVFSEYQSPPANEVNLFKSLGSSLD